MGNLGRDKVHEHPENRGANVGIRFARTDDANPKTV
jgi:hypothetical protein